MNIPALRNLEPNTSLEEFLITLSKYGKPSLSIVSDGWHCRLTMYVTSQGVEFKIDSEFSHKSPMAATRQCYDRLRQALKDLEQAKL